MLQNEKNQLRVVFALLLILTAFAAFLGEWQVGRVAFGTMLLPLLLGIALLKVLFISERFMELAHAPKGWRLSLPMWGLGTLVLVFLILR
jgi:hypothetical protein